MTILIAVALIGMLGGLVGTLVMLVQRNEARALNREHEKDIQLLKGEATTMAMNLRDRGERYDKIVASLHAEITRMEADYDKLSDAQLRDRLRQLVLSRPVTVTTTSGGPPVPSGSSGSTPGGKL